MPNKRPEKTMNAKLVILFAIFISLYTASNFLSLKIVTVCGVVTSVGIFTAPLLFLITDAIEEVYGKDVVWNLIISAIISLVLVFAFLTLSIWMKPAERFAFNKEYSIIFKFSLRMILASITAFFISQLNDVFIFSYLKKRTSGRFLWLRNNVSTMISQTLDTFIFVYLFRYKMTPQFDALFVFQLALPYLSLKILFALCDTPLVYLLVSWLKEDKS